MSSRRRSSFMVGAAAALIAGVALAQQPSMPPGHAPLTGAPPAGQPAQPGQPAQGQPRPPIQLPNFPQQPARANGIQPGRPIGPAGRPLAPGHGGLPVPGRPGARAAAHEPESASHGEEHCPGHGPTDPPPHVNWWHGLLGVNNESAEKGGINSLLWRYQNPSNPCDPKNEPPPFLASILNFGILAFVVYRFGKQPLAEALQKRKQAIMQEIDTASRLKQEAEARLDDYENKLERLDETLAELKSEYAAQAEVEKAHFLAEAEQRRTRMRRDAEFRIEQEFKEVRAMLLQEAVQNAVVAAEALIRQRLGNEDQDRLAEDYLHAVPKALAAGTLRAPSSQTPGAAI